MTIHYHPGGNAYQRTILAGTLVLAALTSDVSAQIANCTSCNLNLPCNQRISQVFMNEDGQTANAYVRSCGPGMIDVPSKHATLITIPAGTNITHVCVGARSTSPFAQNAEVFFSGLDPLTGLPDIDQGTTQFLLTTGDNHHIVPVSWALGGTVWVGVRYPAGACSLAEQGVRPRLTGDAAVWLSGSGWRRYDFVGQAHYLNHTPVIRLISGITSVSPPFLVISSSGNPPYPTNEFGAGFNLGVSLSSEPCDTVIVNVQSSDISEGVVTSPSPLAFGPGNWNVPQSISVAGVDDPVIDGDIPYNIELLVATSLADQCFGGVVSVSAINLDNDTAASGSCPPTPIEWAATPTTVPLQLMNHAMTYDSQRERVVMFGGESVGVFSGDTYEWNGTAWQLIAPAGPGTPPARVLHALSYDSNRGVTVLFGGIDFAGNDLDDTWEWNGFAWQLVASGPASPGGARHDHAMAYDANRGRTVLFGGLPPVGETWEWDGGAWSPVLTPTVPGNGERHMHAMVWNTTTQRVMLFGGVDLLGVHNDLWEYDGLDWQPVIPLSPLPPPAANAQLVYDTNRDVAVLFGGDPNPFPETWDWDNGGFWVQHLPPSTPAATTMHAMAFDEARCTTVVYGGDLLGGGPAPQETYQFPNLLPTSTRTFLVTGTATGVNWSWALNDLGGTWSIENQNTIGVQAGFGASAIVQQFVGSINLAGCCSAMASALPQAPRVFEVSTTEPAGFDLCVGAAGAPATCCVQSGLTCSFNPDIVEIVLSGVDCDANGLDDAIDIAIDPALDSDGDGQIDGCATFILGDLNCDLVVNGLDIQAFVVAITSPADYAVQYPNCNINAADMNSDGAIDLFDRVLFLQLLLQ